MGVFDGNNHIYFNIIDASLEKKKATSKEASRNKNPQ